MYKNKKTGLWEHDFRIDGIGRYHMSYGVSKKAPAETLHATAVALFRSKAFDVIAALRAGKLTIEQLAERRARGESFASSLEANVVELEWPFVLDAIEGYLKGLEQNQNKSPRTRYIARRELNQFIAFLELTVKPEDLARLRLDAITSKMIDDYQAHLVAIPLKPNTVTAYVSRVGSIYQWHRRREDRDARETKRSARMLHVPLDPETITRTITRRERFLSEDEAERLIAATPAPLLFPIAAALFGGFRIDEMCHLRTQHDVDLKLGLLSVQRQPGWKPKTKRSIRHVPIATALRPILEQHLERYSSDEWVTASSRDPMKPASTFSLRPHIRRIIRDADLIPGTDDPKGVTYHTLRHTFASWLLMRGTDVFTVSKLLGNTVQQVENTYGHLAADFRQAAVDRLSNAITLPTLDDSLEPESSATTNATTETDIATVS